MTRCMQPGHIYPMAMFSWPMMPPPKTIDKDIGERRITNWTPVGISLCEVGAFVCVFQGARCDGRLPGTSSC
eukprot:1154444-Pelagomonas_calceolata.AAC.5